MATRFVAAKHKDDEETVDVPAEEGVSGLGFTDGHLTTKNSFLTTCIAYPEAQSDLVMIEVLQIFRSSSYPPRAGTTEGGLLH